MVSLFDQFLWKNSISKHQETERERERERERESGMLCVCMFVCVCVCSGCDEGSNSVTLYEGNIVYVKFKSRTL